ncbi:hypothetical protein BLA29_000782 [Euroglyphus maynei]|uniref:C2H2-type domain-containing protein n=1 Tax=Euroglyphus maynei TaxID=6958 RepID=A0A1Y3AXR3_EURMA|nr:hypothetical protein BLA29_000782 [Euroglyphus maynei]
MDNVNNVHYEYRWILENLCHEYRIAFESLKELMTILPNQEIIQQTDLDRYTHDISIIDSNLNQLSAHYGKYHHYFPYHSFNCFIYSKETLSSSTSTSINDTSNLHYNNYYYDDSNISSSYNNNQNKNLTTLPTTITSNGENYNNNNNNSSYFESWNSNFIAADDANNKNKTTNKSSSSSNQKKLKTNESRIWYKCGWDGCSFGSFYNGVVKRHSYKRHHGKIKIDKSSNLSMHRFKCDWPGCDVSLVAYHKLVEHKRKHTGEKPFRCKWKSCNYATARLYSMIIHERTHKLDSFF